MKFESMPEFPPAGKPEHVGSGAPLETATESVRRIAEAMAKNEEEMKEARRGGKIGDVRALKEKQLELLTERQTILQGVAKNRAHKLRG